MQESIISVYDVRSWEAVLLRLCLGPRRYPHLNFWYLHMMRLATDSRCGLIENPGWHQERCEVKLQQALVHLAKGIMFNMVVFDPK